MACKWIIGATKFLDAAHNAWHRAHQDLQVEKISLTQNANHDFDLSPLDDLSPDAGTAFVAFDASFSNFKRLELMAVLMERGFKLETFISPHAMVADGVKIGLNTFVGDNVIIGHDSRIDYNSVLLPGVLVGSGVHIRPSCWLESGVVVGDKVQIGTHSTLRMGALISPKVKVGRNCELGWPQRYDGDIAAKTTFDPRYSNPIYTYEN